MQKLTDLAHNVMYCLTKAQTDVQFSVSKYLTAEI